MVRTFATIVGLLFLLVGILGFFFENLLGVFHFNTAHNTIHLAIGIWGVLASAKDSHSLIFARGLGFIYVLGGILGFFAPEMFGLMHVGASENILHLVVGAIALYIGFRSETIEPQRLSKSA